MLPMSQVSVIKRVIRLYRIWIQVNPFFFITTDSRKSRKSACPCLELIHRESKFDLQFQPKSIA